MADATDRTDHDATIDSKPTVPEHDFIRHFESLGGAGRGAELGLFQIRHGGATPGLMACADLATNLLIKALENRFDGVGEPENTIIFRHGNSEDWWTRDTRYWMAMRSHVKVQTADTNEAAPAILGRLRSLRGALIADLEAGRKLFMFRDMVNDVDDAQAERLHAAIRAYSATAALFLLRYEDAAHPAGLVEAVKPGLLIGYVTNFTFSRDNLHIGPIDDVLLHLCRRAWALHAAPLKEHEAAEVAAAAAVSSPASAHGSVAASAPVSVAAPAPVSSAAPAPVSFAAPAPVSFAAPAPGRRARPVPRQIVFVGNGQIEAMAGLYRRHVVPRTRDHIDYVSNHEAPGSDRNAILEQADLIVEQVTDISPSSDTGTIAAGTPRILMPLVTGAFLWPFRAQSHPQAKTYGFVRGDAFDADTSDSHLNRMIIAGTDPEEAVETYINLDISTHVSLDGLYELMIDRQRARDTTTGYDTARTIERHFRNEYLFMTPYHPNLRIALELADEMFRRLGAETDDIDRMHARTRVSPFPVGETPIHPGVCRHWGLSYISPDQRYRFRNEGAFTFRESALRYMRHEWNPALEEGLWLADQRRHAEAVGPLRSGLSISPGSARCANALGEALMHTNDIGAGLNELRKAVRIEPSNGAYHADLGRGLRKAGKLPEAEDALRQATIVDPTEPQFEALLADVLRQRGKLVDAAEAYERALALDPWCAAFWRDLAGLRQAQNDAAGARIALDRAEDVDGAGSPAQTQTQTQTHPLAPQRRPGNDGADRMPDEDLAGAQAGPVPQPGQSQAELMLAYSSVVMAPGDAEAYHTLGCLLRDTGDTNAAEQAFRRAIDRRPDHAHYHHELSALFLSLGRLQEAIGAAEQAIERESANPFRYGYLADLLGNARAFDRARAALSAALVMAPSHVPFRISLSNMFAREGRLDAALEVAQALTRETPDNAMALGHLAHVEQMLGRRQDAEMHLRSAIALAPENTHLRGQFERLIQPKAAA